MRIMGTLLISSLIIFPSLTAMRIFKSFKGVVICSSAVAVAAFALGFVVSYYTEMPTGASIVIVNALFFSVFYAIGKLARR